MKFTFTSHISRRDSRLMLLLLAGALALVSVMLVFSAADVGANPAHGIIVGAAVTALVFALIATWQRMRMSFLGKRVLRLVSATREIAAKRPVCADAGNTDKDGELLADEIAEADLHEMGMDPVRDEQGIFFHFQGGYFRMMDTQEQMVRIYYPCIYSSPVEQQNLLARMINRINGAFSLVKLYAAHGAEDEYVAVHAFADILYTSEIPYRKDLLRQLLQSFFDSQHALALAMTAATAQPDGEVMQDEAVCEQGDAELN